MRVSGCLVAIFLGGVLGSLGLASPAKIKNFDLKHVPGELIVKVKGGSQSPEAQSLMAKIGGEVTHVFRASGALRVKVRKAATPAATRDVARVLAADPAVEYVEANTIITLQNTPDDPKLEDLWGMEKISAEAAWEISTGSKDVVVGIIDTGVDYTHPDIAPNYWSNPGETGLDADGNDKSTNGVDDDDNGYVDDFRGWDFAGNDNDPMDDHDHGTHCAGTIGGAGNNGVGVVGVNWEVSVVGLKFISASGSGSTADAIEAIEYATAMGFDMTSNSWGGGGSSRAMQDAIAEAGEAGILFIAAAGNSSANSDRRPMYPAAYDNENIISVAATDSNDRKASFSNYGRETVDLAAPGVSILSTVAGGDYRTMSGTSMACPHVAGAAALVMAAFPDMTAMEVRQKLMDTVDDIGLQVATGGRINLERALTE